MTEQDIETRRARRPGALSPPNRGPAHEGPVPQVREAPARAPSQPVRAVRREAPARRSGAPSPAHRRTRRPGPVPEMREAPARARADLVRTLRREMQPRVPRP